MLSPSKVRIKCLVRIHIGFFILDIRGLFRLKEWSKGLWFLYGSKNCQKLGLGIKIIRIKFSFFMLSSSTLKYVHNDFHVLV